MEEHYLHERIDFRPLWHQSIFNNWRSIFFFFFLSLSLPLGDTLYKNENNFPTALDSATEQHATTMTTKKSIIL